MAEATTSRMKRFYILLAAIAVVGIGAVGYNVTAGRSGTAALVPLDLQALDDSALVAMARGVTKGNPDASIMIVEFGDYQCPGCGQFARDYKAAVELAFVESGRASFTFHDYPLVAMHPHAFVAARAARCAEDQGQFWEYHDHLFQQQTLWSPLTDPVLLFESYAEGLGLNTEDFESCLHSDRHADVVSANLRLAEVIGIPRTPTLLVNVAGRGTREVPGWEVEDIEATIAQLSGLATAN
jgi:protein-disulfide isomerase